MANNTEVVFDNIEQRILKEIEGAHYAIFVSVAWFTNKRLFDALLERAKSNCYVSIIIQLDEINSQIESGQVVHTALVESSCSRLRAVMMASLTTILGMIPLLTDDLFGSMAVTIMGGLLFSTLATLIYLPILYALFFKIKIK